MANIDTIKAMTLVQTKILQHVCGTFLYYVKVVDFSILVEYGKYCYFVLLSCMSLRSIVRRVSLEQLSLRNIPSSSTVNLDRVQVRFGQKIDRHDDLRSKHIYRPRTEYASSAYVSPIIVMLLG